MNNVQRPYAPPRLIALVLGAVVFAIYQFGWRETLLPATRYDYPPTLLLVIACALVAGYEFTMLGWLIVQTKGQIAETFRPTRGRILATIALFLVMPVAVISYMPWIVGGLLPLAFFDMPLYGYPIILGVLIAIYPLAAMIVRHTYQRRWLRFWLFSLTFWTGYAGLTLINGVTIFRL